jgi:DNA polymerase-3 subunit epsilon
VAPPQRPRTWVAIDFETACEDAASACAIGIVRHAGARTRRAHWLIRPPSKGFSFTYIHGISWRTVAKEPTFGELWPELARFLADVEFIAAHNAAFDRSVLRACCAHAGVAMPPAPWLCTVKLGRAAWGVYPTKLPNLARFLGADLNHHDALSDASVCAEAVKRAIREGRDLEAAKM